MKRILLFIIIILLCGCDLFNKSTSDEPDNPPEIRSKKPSEPVLEQAVGDTVNFEVTGDDPDNDPYSFIGKLNGADVPLQVDGDKASYLFIVPAKGTYEFLMIIQNTYVDTAKWNINVKNTRPAVNNVQLLPVNATTADTLKLMLEKYDLENDQLTEIIKWYSGDSPIQTGGRMLLPENTSVNDTIKTTVRVYDGDLYSELVTSNALVVQPLPTRTISGNIFEYFSQLPDANAKIMTSIDTVFTDVNGNYSVRAATDSIVYLVALKDKRLASGFTVQAGESDEVYNHRLINNTKEHGVDEWLLENYVLKSKLHYGSDLGRSPNAPDGVYVAFTEESVPDTVWVLGDMDGELLLNVTRFPHLQQINDLGKKINGDLAEASSGLFNENETIIAIADSSYIGEQFDYPNMVEVKNTAFPKNNLDYIRSNVAIYGIGIGIGLNSASFENDDVTIRGGKIGINQILQGELFSKVFNSEMYAMLLGDVEVPEGYGSVLEGVGGIIDPHDTRLTTLSIYLGPGHYFPDFPKDFKPEIIAEYSPFF